MVFVLGLDAYASAPASSITTSVTPPVIRTSGSTGGGGPAIRPVATAIPRPELVAVQFGVAPSDGAGLAVPIENQCAVPLRSRTRPPERSGRIVMPRAPSPG